MVLLLGICKGLKAMHNYKVGVTGRGSEGVAEAKKVKGQADRADEEMERAARDEADDEDDASNSGEVPANSSRRRRRRDGDVENEPLMDDEITTSQEGVGKGQIRAYAHRDIKPGEYLGKRQRKKEAEKSFHLTITTTTRAATALEPPHANIRLSRAQAT